MGRSRLAGRRRGRVGTGRIFGARANSRSGAVTGMVIIAATLIASTAQAGATEVHREARAAGVRSQFSARSLATGTSSAGAGSGGYPYARAVNCAKKYGPQSWCIKGKDISPLGYKYRNDTDYVAWMFKRVFGISLPRKLGSGGDWEARLKAAGYALSDQPRVGDIAILPASKTGSGHVAYVFAVSRGTGWLDEYNANGSGTFSDSGTSRQIGNGSGPVVYASPTSGNCPAQQQLMHTPAVAVNPKTGLGSAAAVGPSDSLYVYWQSPNGAWNGPYGLDGGAPGIAYSSPAIIIDPTTGLPVVMAEGPSHSMYAYWENANGSWSGPYGLGGGKAGIAWSAPAIGYNSATGLITALAEARQAVCTPTGGTPPASGQGQAALTISASA